MEVVLPRVALLPLLEMEFTSQITLMSSQSSLETSDNQVTFQCLKWLFRVSWDLDVRRGGSVLVPEWIFFLISESQVVTPNVLSSHSQGSLAESWWIVKDKAIFVTKAETRIIWCYGVIQKVLSGTNHTTFVELLNVSEPLFLHLLNPKPHHCED